MKKPKQRWTRAQAITCTQFAFKQTYQALTELEGKEDEKLKDIPVVIWALAVLDSLLKETKLLPLGWEVVVRRKPTKKHKYSV